jgi:hypothetical protein
VPAKMMAPFDSLTPSLKRLIVNAHLSIIVRVIFDVLDGARFSFITLYM